MSDQNVAVLHCKAGKGRTGTAIASYLLFSDHQQWSTNTKNTPEESASIALAYFATQRSKSGIGVQVPSQRRSVRQFSQCLCILRTQQFEQQQIEKEDEDEDTCSNDDDDDGERKEHTVDKGDKGDHSRESTDESADTSSCNSNDATRQHRPPSIPSFLNLENASAGGLLLVDPIGHPKALHLTQIIMKSIPNYDNVSNGLSLVIKIFTAASQNKPSLLLFNSAWHGTNSQNVMASNTKQMNFIISPNLEIKGDVQVRGYNMNEQIFRFMFHTSFLSSTNSADSTNSGKVLVLRKKDVDSASKSNKFSDEHFSLELFFDDKNDKKLEENQNKNQKVDDIKDIVTMGWLDKEGGWVKSWKRRYFVLHCGFLRYFEHPESPICLKEIDLSLYIVSVVDTIQNRRSIFTLVPDDEQLMKNKSSADSGSLKMSTNTKMNTTRHSRTGSSMTRRKEKKRERSRVYVFQAESDEVCMLWVNRIVKMWTWCRIRKDEMAST